MALYFSKLVWKTYTFNCFVIINQIENLEIKIKFYDKSNSNYNDYYTCLNLTLIIMSKFNFNNNSYFITKIIIRSGRCKIVSFVLNKNQKVDFNYHVFLIRGMKNWKDMVIIMGTG